MNENDHRQRRRATNRQIEVQRLARIAPTRVIQIELRLDLVGPSRDPARLPALAADLVRKGESDFDARPLDLVYAALNQGTVIKEPQDIPGIIRFAVVADPQGAGFLIAKGMVHRQMSAAAPGAAAAHIPIS